MRLITLPHRPSTLQVDTHSGGGGACRHRCHLSIVIVDSHHPSTLQADTHSSGGGACCHCCHLVLAFHPQVHPTSSCSRSWVGVVCCLLCTLTPYKQWLIGMEHVCEVSRCTAKAITLLVMQQRLRHREALILWVSPFMGLPAPLYHP